jgi:hypothetical protein
LQSTRWLGLLLILPVGMCRVEMSWRSHWRCGTASSQEPSDAGRLDHDQLRSDRADDARCAMNGGDVAVAELVQNVAWAKISEGVLGEPTAKTRIACHRQ